MRRGALALFTSNHSLYDELAHAGIEHCCKATKIESCEGVFNYRGAVEKKTVLENLDLVLLAMDETVDKG